MGNEAFAPFDNIEFVVLLSLAMNMPHHSHYLKQICLMPWVVNNSD